MGVLKLTLRSSPFATRLGGSAILGGPAVEVQAYQRVEQILDVQEELSLRLGDVVWLAEGLPGLH
jgi:hypothetical protein